jgi:hypothetical protein
LTYSRIFTYFIWGKVTRRRLAGGGAALVRQLLYQAMRRNISIWVESPAIELIENDHRLVGVIVKKEGRTLRILARRAIHLGGGGFARNAEMRQRYLPVPVTRGANVYDRYFGDPRIKPNPCLAPLVKPLFSSPGSMHRAIRRRRPFDAVTPAPGCMLGPALTFSYFAMKHAAGSAGKIRESHRPLRATESSS